MSPQTEAERNMKKNATAKRKAGEKPADKSGAVVDRTYAFLRYLHGADGRKLLIGSDGRAKNKWCSMMLVYLLNIQDALKKKTISLRRGAVITEILSVLEPLEDSVREHFGSLSGSDPVEPEFAERLAVSEEQSAKLRKQLEQQQAMLTTMAAFMTSMQFPGIAKIQSTASASENKDGK
eukprot:1896668-Amphidinium_carterae.1